MIFKKKYNKKIPNKKNINHFSFNKQKTPEF